MKKINGIQVTKLPGYDQLKEMWPGTNEEFEVISHRPIQPWAVNQYMGTMVKPIFDKHEIPFEYTVSGGPGLGEFLGKVAGIGAAVAGVSALFGDKDGKFGNVIQDVSKKVSGVSEALGSKKVSVSVKDGNEAIDMGGYTVDSPLSNISIKVDWWSKIPLWVKIAAPIVVVGGIILYKRKKGGWAR
jgi:hypothetical protein